MANSSCSDDTLSAADLALGYKQLHCVECAGRWLKTALKLRPVFHWVLIASTRTSP